MSDIDAKTYARNTLEQFTRGVMENVVKEYKHRLDEKNITRVIEFKVAEQLVEWMGDDYTEIDITALVGTKYTSVVTQYMIDEKIMLIAIHEEVNPVETVASRMINKKIKFSISARSSGEKREEVNSTFTSGFSAGYKKQLLADIKNDKPYNPLSQSEDFTFPNFVNGRGSRVETLPGGQDMGEVDKDMEYFRKRLYAGMIKPKPPTESSPMTSKTTAVVPKKPTIDLKQISSLSTPSDSNEIPRGAGTWVGIDLAAYDIKEDIYSELAKETAKEIDAKIMKVIWNDAITKGETSTYTFTEPTTYGWTEERTNWNNAVAWHVDPKLTQYEPYRTSMEEISFTEEDLDELTDLLNDNKSKVMEFA